jgi:uncharacterized membrane protein YsdA (DUF1294 family)
MKYVYSYLLIINIISFLLYYVDKRNSIKHKWRIPEKCLLLLSIIGGSLGSIISMFLFHHKTKHIKFLIINPLCLIIDILFLFKLNNII